jgi:hypothetical protein
VVIDTFQQLKDESDTETLFMTDEQTKWLRMQRMMLLITPKREASRDLAPFPPAWDLICRDWIGKKLIEQGIFCCIMANTFVMGAQHLGQSNTVTNAIHGLEVFFTLVFLVEAVLKLLGMGTLYFDDHWNVFDFFVVSTSVLGLVFELFLHSNSSMLSMLVVLRFVRIGRVFRLMTTFKTVKILFNTILFALPSLCNIVSLLFLMYFIYAVLGIQLFAKTPLGANLNWHANFRTFSSALLLVIRISTGEGWNGIMHEVDAMEGAVYAKLYFYSFTVLMSLVFVNLFIAVILDTFEGCTETENGNTEEDCTDMEGGMSAEQYKTFCQLWANMDPEMDWTIDHASLRKVLQQLKAPLGMKKEGESKATDDEADAFIKSLQIKVQHTHYPSLTKKFPPIHLNRTRAQCSALHRNTQLEYTRLLPFVEV